MLASFFSQNKISSKNNICTFTCFLLGELFDMLLPMLSIYQEYVRNHHYSLQVYTFPFSSAYFEIYNREIIQKSQKFQYNFLSTKFAQLLCRKKLKPSQFPILFYYQKLIFSYGHFWYLILIDDSSDILKDYSSFSISVFQYQFSIILSSILKNSISTNFNKRNFILFEMFLIEIIYRGFLCVNILISYIENQDASNCHPRILFSLLYKIYLALDKGSP